MAKCEKTSISRYSCIRQYGPHPMQCRTAHSQVRYVVRLMIGSGNGRGQAASPRRQNGTVCELSPCRIMKRLASQSRASRWTPLLCSVE
jgi:hypothetical protein